MKTRIQHLRESYGLSRAELAEKAGTSFATIRRVERGLHAPRYATLRKIAAALDVSPGYLLDGGAEPTTVGYEPAALVICRDRLGLSRAELAERSGVSVMTIWLMETGASESVLPETLVRLADALEVEPGVLSTEFDLMAVGS
jgi:transcriptional regulator with XRE-family HTH domain